MKFTVFIGFCFSMMLGAQNAVIAENYYTQGAFEKALYEYKKVYEDTPNSATIRRIVGIYQQLERYQDAEIFLKKLIKKSKTPFYNIDLGYNYQLKSDSKNAELYYKKALEAIDENPIYTYNIARRFERYSLLDYAISAYKHGMERNPKSNFNLHLARIYGEQGHIETMFLKYIDYLKKTPTAMVTIQRAISDFISEDSDHENNILLRKVLLKTIQQTPDVHFNKLLSWLFVQQKDYQKAFTQEKAIYSRTTGKNIRDIKSLAKIATQDKDYAVALKIFNFLIEKSPHTSTKISATQATLAIQTLQATQPDYPALEAAYQASLKTYGRNKKTLGLQLDYAQFLAFQKAQPKAATALLEKTLKLPISVFQKAQMTFALANILVLEEKFNKALIYFSKIQRSLKNSTIAQAARFKVAQTSYYKGDFEWAETQLKVLKSSTSQLIANDALDLKLLIADNKGKDSLHTALKQYAKADLRAFQNKKEQAIALLNDILTTYNQDPIVPQALFKQAELFSETGAFEKAEVSYATLIASYPSSILIDDALFKLGEIYQNQLLEPEKAKACFEKIIFNHPDSIYYVDARKKYRALRGDTIN